MVIVTVFRELTGAGEALRGFSVTFSQLLQNQDQLKRPFYLFNDNGEGLVHLIMLQLRSE